MDRLANQEAMKIALEPLESHTIKMYYLTPNVHTYAYFSFNISDLN